MTTERSSQDRHQGAWPGVTGAGGSGAGGLGAGGSSRLARFDQGVLAVALLDQLPSHVAVLDAEGTIIATSGAWRRFQERNGGESVSCGVGANYLRVCDASSKSCADAAHVARAIRSVVAGEADHFFHTYECSSPTERRWFQLRVQAMERVEGAARLVMVVHQSITEAESLAQDRLARMSEAAHASRLCHIGRTAVELIHEVTQPLAAVRNYAAGSLRHLSRGSNPIELREAFEVIQKEVARAETIIKRARAFAARNELVREVFDLGTAVRELLKLWDPHLRSIGCEARADEGPTRPWPEALVVGDRSQIEQVLVNALCNAADAARMAASKDGGGRSVVDVSLACSDGWARVQVKDRGPGLSAPVRRRLFEPFHTTKPNGLGMGLAISRSIAESHDGRVSLDNRPDGVGAVFVLELPLSGVKPSGLEDQSNAA